MGSKLKTRLESLLSTARKLEALWIARERQQRPNGLGTAQSEATKQCRLDLQKAFALNS